jgi:hypothetical protein
MLASLFGISTLEQDVNPEYYKKLINPGNIIDGHCASCAFNTYLTLKGYDPKPALEPNGRYKIFGDWFYERFVPNMPKFVGEFLELTNENSTDTKAFEIHVKNELKKVTNPGDVFLVCVSDGAHWFVGFNKKGEIYFIDSQTGRSFGVLEIDGGIVQDTYLTFIKIPDEMIKEYFNEVLIRINEGKMNSIRGGSKTTKRKSNNKQTTKKKNPTKNDKTKKSTKTK